VKKGQPRQLVVARIDDNLISLRERNQPESAADLATRLRDLALYTWPHKQDARFEWTGIDGWDSARAFWHQLDPDRKIDLIVSDVRFDRATTTPVHRVLQQLQLGGRATEAASSIPTGLGHVRSLIAWAAALRRPVGIAVYTADPGLWDRLLNHDPNVTAQLLGAWAVHEVGEILAILGDDQLVAGASLEQNTRRCLDWLHSTKNNFIGGCRVALVDYRRRLIESAVITEKMAVPNVYVPPSSWIQLFNWCQEQAQSPQPWNGEAPGVQLCFRDGITADLLSLASLFADADDWHPDSTPLDAACYTTDRVAPADPWQLDDMQRPRIGAFINSLGTMSRAVDRAWKAVSQFDVRLEQQVPRNLRKVINGQNGEARLARGLVLLFQILRRDEENLRVWEEAVEMCQWDHKELRFLFNEPPPSCSETLCSRLTQLIVLMRNKPPEFDLSAVFDWEEWCSEQDVRQDAAWVRWHVNLLVFMGVVEQLPDAKYRLVKYSLPSPMPMPDPVPDGDSHDAFIGRSAMTFLLETLGFSEDHGPDKSNNWNALTQILAGAFGKIDSLEEAGIFIEAFCAGEGPTWLKDICRDVAKTRMGWVNEDSWPSCIARVVQ